jgi:4-diphosphocytidyl-2-C-methyl-D-erythritol kinase
MKNTRPRSRTAHAKINLTLSVSGRTQDGFHTLESIFLRIGLADVLDVKVSSPRPSFELAADDLFVEGEIDCPPEENLVLVAARTIRREARVALPPLHFSLQKQVPVAAGLGGGSSDAAATITAAEAAWGGRFSAESQSQIIRELGSDVPFFASGAPAALVKGRGEQVEPLPSPRGTMGLILVTPAERLRSRDVFTSYDENERYRGASSPAAAATADLRKALEGGIDGPSVAQLARDLHDANDLWPAASRLSPALPGIRATLERRLERPLIMSGSGPTLVALYPSAREAGLAARSVAEAHLVGLEGATVIATDLTNSLPVWRTPQ